ncbi:MAG TPA: OsmC family protein [Cyclobacteriaceae bacterium]|nr:OsmC family protein [Cyclobacteriaceae bacterium]
MAKISSSIKSDRYKVEITSPTGNLVIADEPVAQGGKDLGFSPKELLASALAACTSATVMMYADRNKIDLQEVKMEVDLEGVNTSNKTIINRKIQFIGNLDEVQRTKLLKVANACPVHKILTNTVEINTAIM